MNIEAIAIAAIVLVVITMAVWIGTTLKKSSGSDGPRGGRPGGNGDIDQF